MKRVPVQSSNIVSIGYDQGDFILEIEFHGGRVYQYLSVQPEVHQGLMSAHSIGSYFHQNIKGRYAAQSAEWEF